jgi:hypothetical protein
MFLQTHATSYIFYNSVRKPYPLSYDLRNPYRNLKKTSTKLYVREFGFSTAHCKNNNNLNIPGQGEFG